MMVQHELPPVVISGKSCIQPLVVIDDGKFFGLTLRVTSGKWVWGNLHLSPFAWAELKHVLEPYDKEASR